MRETEDQLKVIPQFCFPDAKDWAPVDNFPRSVTYRRRRKRVFPANNHLLAKTLKSQNGNDLAAC